MGVYDRPIATARRLIEKYGEECVWSKQADQDATNEDMPWRDVRAGDPWNTSVKIAFFPAGGDSALAAVLVALADSPEVSISSEYGLMAGDYPFEPDVSDTLVNSKGDTVEIIKITPLKPGGPVVLYKIWVER